MIPLWSRRQISRSRRQGRVIEGEERAGERGRQDKGIHCLPWYSIHIQRLQLHSTLCGALHFNMTMKTNSNLTLHGFTVFVCNTQAHQQKCRHTLIPTFILHFTQLSTNQMSINTVEHAHSPTHAHTRVHKRTQAHLIHTATAVINEHSDDARTNASLQNYLLITSHNYRKSTSPWLSDCPEAMGATK